MQNVIDYVTLIIAITALGGLGVSIYSLILTRSQIRENRKPVLKFAYQGMNNSLYIIIKNIGAGPALKFNLNFNFQGERSMIETKNVEIDGLGIDEEYSFRIIRKNYVGVAGVMDAECKISGHVYDVFDKKISITKLIKIQFGHD